MPTLQHIGRTLCRAVKQAGSLPRLIGRVLKQRQRQVQLDADEAERLDRIRNPSKYLGK